MTKPKKNEAELLAPEQFQESQSLIPMPSIDLQALMEKALMANASIETVERLVALSERMREQWARQQFIKALSKFQKECPPIVKSKPVFKKSASPKEKEDYFKKGDTSSVTYCYAPLEDILRQATPSLSANGFSYTIKAHVNVKEMELTAVCELHHVDGHTEPTDFPIPIGSEYMSKQQQFGAAMSFAKRYAFLNATGLQPVGEDNDAQEPEKKTKGSDDHKFKGPQSKSRKDEADQDVEATEGMKEKYPAIVRTNREGDRLQPSNLTTMKASMKRLRVPEEKFSKDFGFPMEEMHKGGLNSMIDWMKEVANA